MRWRRRRRLPENAQIQCGSGLARESGVTVNLSLPDTLHSRASPLPHWICVVLSSVLRPSGTSNR
ncbi:hypothetical protein EAH72_32510 [Pseudomonas caspiana]|uniref:Uncharacterized protein n=1 Tax=Pseudomonas mandelii TaxID=75612 RepID=A0A502HJY5_9PSED|nr:hypothetical protein EAH74_32365 [Pseudomonas mandelii]TPG88934.1 hypothetical protein EAH72_32510 [Pseudomonas caspiana]